MSPNQEFVFHPERFIFVRNVRFINSGTIKRNEEHSNVIFGLSLS